MTNVLIVGPSGKGKSLICELLSGQTGLTAPDRSAIHTASVTGHPIPGTEVTIFDSPCFGNSEGRDCLFLMEYARQEVALAAGLSVVCYVKSALDRLETRHRRDIAVLNELFAQQPGRLVVLLTFADQEADSDLEQSLRDHRQALGQPVYPVFGQGPRTAESLQQLLGLLAVMARVPPVVTSQLQAVQAEQAQLEELQQAHPDAPLQRQLGLLKAQLLHRDCRREREVAALRSLIAARERHVFSMW